MAKVYISSTYRDLRAEREAAAQTVRRLGHQSIAMEDYTASSEKPLEKCLADVRDCQMFIGIYAWRYGFIPKGHKKSITHLEYDEAVELDIPRFLFLVHEDAAWPTSSVDDDRTMIKAFRTAAEEASLVSYFKNCDELSAHISVSLRVRTDSSLADRSEVLPYLCDRSEQEVKLMSAFDSLDMNKLRRPFICVIHGEQQECHWEFVQRMRRILLPKLLKLDGKQASIKEYLPKWDFSSDTIENRLRKLRANLSSELVDNSKANGTEMVEAIIGLRQPVMINYHLSADANYADELQLLDRLIAFFGGWPDLAPGCDLIFSFGIKYKNRQELSWLEKLMQGKSVEKLRASIASFAFQKHNLVGVVLPELTSVPCAEVEHWALKHESEFRDMQKVLREIPLIYKRLKSEALPMDQLLDALKILTNKYCR